MQVFGEREVKEAIRYAAEGGQALHVHRIIADPSRAPRCFRAAVERGEPIAHLFDQSPGRLLRTARELGVTVLVIERRGTARQHVDLCGAPLRRALNRCAAQRKALAEARMELYGAPEAVDDD